MKTVKFKQWDCIIEFKEYANGGKCLQLVNINDGEPIATATTWIEGLNPDEIAVKDYSENEGMYEALREANIIHPLHRTIPSGYIDLLVTRLMN